MYIYIYRYERACVCVKCHWVLVHLPVSFYEITTNRINTQNIV